jgi:hypothetical protein
VRWQFGMLGPAGAAEAGAGEDLDVGRGGRRGAAGRNVDAYVRFQQAVARVQRRTSTVGRSTSCSLTAPLILYEAVAREIPLLTCTWTT